MNDLQRILAQAVEVLDEVGVRFALVGGLAVSARVEARFTRDVDLAVSVTGDRQAESVARELTTRGYHLLTLVEQEATGQVATIRVAPPGESPEGVVLDLLFASSGIEPELIAAAEGIEVWPGATIPVAAIGHLMALKLLSRCPARPQDDIDLVALAAVATASDLEAAAAAVELIERRGANRGRDLHGDLARLARR